MATAIDVVLKNIEEHRESVSRALFDGSAKDLPSTRQCAEKSGVYLSRILL